LVINDNPYGLIFALRYYCRAFPWAMLDHHLLISRLKEEYKELIAKLIKPLFKERSQA
jgi:hypothetical protein